MLIAAARGVGEVAARAMEILDDPDREFASSTFIRLEVLDLLRIAAATAVQADELATTEEPRKPIHRATTVKVISIRH